jgi:hypothetical protein
MIARSSVRVPPLFAASAAAARRKASHHPVERVAIIGGGIAGLSLAHALLSSNMRDELLAKAGAEAEAEAEGGSAATGMNVEIFESRSGFDYEKSGSGIQLTGGMAALRRMSPALQRRASDAALPLGGVTSRCRPWFGGGGDGGGDDDDDDEGWKILELDVRKTILDDDADDADAGRRRTGLVTEEGEVLAYAMMRGTLQRVLHEGLTDDHGLGVTFGRRLTGVSYASSSSSSSSEGGEGIMCEFDDGSTSGPYDLVVGCDGIQSAVRQYVNDGEIRPSSSSSSPPASAVYSGLRITFAIQDGGTKNVDGGDGGGRAAADYAADDDGVCRFNQYFGTGAYALTSSYGTGKGRPPARGAFLVYADEDYVGPFRKSKKSGDIDGGASTGGTMASPPPPSSSAADPPQRQPDENPDWTQDRRVSRDRVAETLEVLRSARVPGGGKVSDIVRGSDRSFDLGVYLHNPFSRNGWVREVRRGGGGGRFGGWVLRSVRRGRGDRQVRRHDRGCVARHAAILGTGRESGVAGVSYIGGGSICFALPHDGCVASFPFEEVSHNNMN